MDLNREVKLSQRHEPIQWHVHHWVHPPPQPCYSAPRKNEKDTDIERDRQTQRQTKKVDLLQMTT